MECGDALARVGECLQMLSMSAATFCCERAHYPYIYGNLSQRSALFLNHAASHPSVLSYIDMHDDIISYAHMMHCQQVSLHDLDCQSPQAVSNSWSCRPISGLT